MLTHILVIYFFTLLASLIKYNLIIIMKSWTIMKTTSQENSDEIELMIE